MQPRRARKLYHAAIVVWCVPCGLPLSIIWRDSVPWLVLMSWLAILIALAAGLSAERPTESA